MTKLKLFTLFFLIGLNLFAQHTNTDYFKSIKTGKIKSDPSITWRNFGPGMSGYCEEFWCHPTDTNYFYDNSTGEFVLYLIEQTVFEEKGVTINSKGGIYKSVDGGINWTNITGNFSIELNAIDYPTEKDRFYKTIAYWFGISKQEAKVKYKQLPDQSLPVLNRIVVNPLNQQEIYISYNKKHDFTFGPGDVWKTEDGGKTWFACARQGAYWKSANDTSYWKNRNNPVGTNVQFAHLQRYMDHTWALSGNRMLTINAKGQVFIGIDQQTLKSTDQGKTWEKIFKAPFVWQTETSPLNPDLIVISVAGQSVKIAHEFMNPGIYLSKDGGKIWKKINKNLGQPDKIVDVKPDPYNEDVLWCASWGSGWFIAYLNDTTEGWLKK